LQSVPEGVIAGSPTGRGHILRIFKLFGLEYVQAATLKTAFSAFTKRGIHCTVLMLLAMHIFLKLKLLNDP
jgi:hypothetical protein